MKKPAAAPTEIDAGALLEGIARGSDEEIAALEREASDYAGAKAKSAEAKIAAIENETREALREQLDAIGRSLASRLALERKKADLAARDDLARAIESKARLMLDEKAAEPGYRGILLEWTVEASIGLGCGKATVNAGPAELELMDEAFLREAEERILAICGRSATLIRAREPLRGDRGVELTADGGRLSYDNRVAARFARAAGAIRSIVYAAAYGDGNKL